MRKIMQRILSSALVVVAALNLSVAVFASNAPMQEYYSNNAVISENETIKISETHDAVATYRTVIDKKEHTVQMIVIYKNGKTVASKEVEIDAFSLEAAEHTFNTRASIKENTFSNYEYTITYGSQNTWELRRPDGNAGTYYFKTYETTKNAAYLAAFKGYVDTINEIEFAIIRKASLYALSCLVAGATGAGAIFTGGTLSPAAWASLVAAAGCGDAVLAECFRLDRACKNAYDSYWNAYYKSEVFY